MPFIMTRATVTVLNCDGARVGFNDPTPVIPVGGNNGTTLGQQKMIAFQAAANNGEARLRAVWSFASTAVWTALTCTVNSAVLGSAGTAEVFRDFAGAPVGGHWYPKGLANKFTPTLIPTASI
jgi:hypothetical protein